MTQHHGPAAVDGWARNVQPSGIWRLSPAAVRAAVAFACARMSAPARAMRAFPCAGSGTTVLWGTVPDCSYRSQFPVARLAWPGWRDRAQVCSHAGAPLTSRTFLTPHSPPHLPARFRPRPPRLGSRYEAAYCHTVHASQACATAPRAPSAPQPQNPAHCGRDQESSSEVPGPLAQNRSHNPGSACYGGIGQGREKGGRLGSAGKGRWDAGQAAPHGPRVSYRGVGEGFRGAIRRRWGLAGPPCDSGVPLRGRWGPPGLQG